MVTIENTGVTLLGRPIGFCPQTGDLLTLYFEVVKQDNTVFRPYERRAVSLTPDISMPNRAWIVSPREDNALTHIIVYDLENNTEVAKTDTDSYLNFEFDWSSPVFLFNYFGEKYYVHPLNPRRGRALIFGYWTLSYARIADYWSYLEMYKYAWESGQSPGFSDVPTCVASKSSLILCTSASNNLNIFKLLSTNTCYYFGFGSWWSLMFNEIFVAPPVEWSYGTIRGNVIICDKNNIYFTYLKDVNTTESHLVLRRLNDGSEITLLVLPYKYGSYVTFCRRCAKDKLLFVIYYGDVRNDQMKYGFGNANVRLVVVDLYSFTVTDLGDVATGTKGGNEYGFIDSSNILYRIKLAEEYIIKLYRESQTRIKIVTTKPDGTPVSLTLSVYKCDNWMDTYRGGDRKELIGTVTTGSDGVGYFEYDGELTILHFEWARDDEGYAYNYIVAGIPKYRALKYGNSDWYA